MKMKTGNIARRSTDYEVLGLKKTNKPEVWEDGLRTTGEKGTFEWWYFDAHLDDGSTIVILYHTKSMTKADKPLTPYIIVTIDKKDGSNITKAYEYDKDKFFASKDSCDVTIDGNYFRGNLKEYEIYFKDEDLELTAKIHRTSESWRPGTATDLFDSKGEKYFSWVVAVPKGEAEITYTYKGEKTQAKGSCYHDHNWGTISLAEVLNHWYWGRVDIGPYNIIANQSKYNKKYGNSVLKVINFSKNGKVVADNEDYLTVYRSIPLLDKEFKKDISDDLVFMYDDPNDEYRYELYLFREKTIQAADLLENAVDGKGLKYALAKIFTGFDGAYYRFLGRAELKVYKGNTLIEEFDSKTAVWELMYLGKPFE